MNSLTSNTGLSFVPVGTVTEETKMKLEKMMDNKLEKLKIEADAYASGKLIIPKQN